MLVRDIIYNDTFDFNANFAVYECNGDACWQEVEPVFSTAKDPWPDPWDSIMSMTVKYLTIHNNVLIIEADASANQE